MKLGRQTERTPRSILDKFFTIGLTLKGLDGVLELAGRLWAYPWMIAFLLTFIGYQVSRMAVSFSWGLLLLTVFDVFIVWLTWREYRKARPSVSADG